MANVNSPFGLKPIRHLNGNPWNGQFELGYLPSSDGNNYFVGDPVDLEGTGADATGKYPLVTHATVTDGGYIYGVIVGFANKPDSGFADSLENIYGPASTVRYPMLVVDPDVVFLIQDYGGATTALTKDAVGLNAVGYGTMSTAGSTTTGLSGLTLDDGTTTSPSANSSNTLFILRLHDVEDNALGAYARWEVLINMHRLRATGDGDGALGV